MGNPRSLGSVLWGKEVLFRVCVTPFPSLFAPKGSRVLVEFLLRGSVRITEWERSSSSSYCTEWEFSSSYSYGEVSFELRSGFLRKNIPQPAIIRTPHLARLLFSRGKSDLRRNCVPEFEHAN